MTSPIVFVLFDFKLRAIMLGVYPSSCAAASTLSAVSGETVLRLEYVLDTVATETPASFATSLLVAIKYHP